MVCVRLSHLIKRLLTYLLTYKRHCPLDCAERPSRLYFEGHERAAELTATENDPISLQCVARQVLPLPHLQIRVRNHSVSDHLTANSSVNVHCRDPACGPVHYDLDARLTVPRLVVRHGDDGHYVTCSARLRRSNWTPNQTALRLNVRCT